MEIYLTSKFRKVYKKLPTHIKEKAKEKEKIFRKNPFNHILETHLLHGKYKGYWAFSVDYSYSYRIMFKFLDATKTKVAFNLVNCFFLKIC
ncbi:type II toxin-antitoxin system mRNA interferase toxin, RelE/StbE family [Patescibacteria group bacterium]|nr:type II toxin-antitoxin system mRNA interferase toxin, RelE/StbE family [Patescibacteria group bacterium]MBU4480946.1 type II toxin-antitoxin system mRNA interferase toxin, RelE/StbE family [Patescibacteria group bacterium]